MYGRFKADWRGKVRIENMKCRNALQARSHQQDYSGHLKAYAQIELSERGKVRSCAFAIGGRII